MGPSSGEISFSFACLQTLMKSFRDVAEGTLLESGKRDAICELVTHLGEVAIPVLIRNLFAADTDSGEWASQLLLHLSKNDDAKRRVQRELRSYQDAPNLSQFSLLRVADLLATLDGWQDELPVALPTEILHAECVSDQYLAGLAECINSPSDVAHVVGVLLNDLPPHELQDFIESMALHEPGCAKALVQELVLRDDLERKYRQTLRGVAASLSEVFNEIPLSIGQRPTLQVATHSSGATAIVVYLALPQENDPEDEVPLYRAMRLDIDVRRGLTSSLYLCDLSRGDIDEKILHALVEASYELRPIQESEARKRVVLAMRTRSRRGQSMPNCYYLGRDMLGLQGEHLGPSNDAECDSAAFFSRGTELYQRGNFGQAKELLIKYLQQRPSDPEAMSVLASCLIELQETDRARYYLEQACSLAPAVGRYHWNLASLAHREGRLGECYIAFQQYLKCQDSPNQGQRDLATQFLRTYARKNSLPRPSHAISLADSSIRHNKR
ncbi:MAG: tetratricopeptide repeat protein [Kofleriaceae bacterium]|nr:tetratricopeptide repeat protein [Kofleriaceae bacterium]